jgi:hypothetical protein
VISLALLFAACLASASSRGDDAAVEVGKQFASSSTVPWDVSDANHPALGPIRFAARRVAATTTVGGRKFVSQSYVSCQKGGGKIAIELSSAPEDNLAAGLAPKGRPTLTCYSPDPKSGGGLAMSEIPAKWEINDLGDAMVSGLSPAALRRCASIDVLQEVTLPAGWSQPSQQVVMELLPYSRALDAVFAACGERSVYAAGEKPPAAAWKPARTIAKGQTNVRADARLESPLVVKLGPGTKLLVQPTGTDWWKVKPGSGERFSGYIRKDRLVFE